MNRLRFLGTLGLVIVLAVTFIPRQPLTLAQNESAPAGTPVSEPIDAGDWTFQVLTVERTDSFYAERLGTVFSPDGVFVVPSLAITYTGSSTNVIDRLVAAGVWFSITTADGESFRTDDQASAAFAVEESYRDDTPFPRLPSNGVAEPNVTYFQRYIFDIPAAARDLTFTSLPTAPDQFAIPLPDPPVRSGPKTWELTVRKTELWERLDPPMTPQSHAADGIYVVVFVTVTKLTDSDAGFNMNWFVLQMSGDETYTPAVEESFAMGVPIASLEAKSYEFALVFDVPNGVEAATLITVDGSPLEVEIPLQLTTPPTPTPTSTPTATPTATPTMTPTPESTPTATPTPAPGSIRVVSAEGSGSSSLGANVAVEVILDTSGSMLQPLGDTTRIEVARAALVDLLDTGLAPDIPFALRVFGTEPDSCETRLLVPLGPLDPEGVIREVQALQVVNLVKTPLGAALEQVAVDLADAGGTRIIVLITDGEETCGGDPEQVIREMVDRGFDVHVNIVGFALDDDALKATFREWARIGNGRYIDAGNADELRNAVNEAVRPPFRVLDASGDVVAEGVVDGDPVEVPAGTYRIDVSTSPVTSFESVVVDPGAVTTVTLDG